MAGTITRWRPFAEFDELRRRMDHMFEEMGNGDRGHEWNLAVDVIERGDRCVVRADVPGMRPEDVQIEVKDEALTVSAEHAESTEEHDGQYVRRERRVRSFTRTLPLPRGVTADQIDAVCKDGVLEVSFPTAAGETPEPVTITPKAG